MVVVVVYYRDDASLSLSLSLSLSISFSLSLSLSLFVVGPLEVILFTTRLVGSAAADLFKRKGVKGDEHRQVYASSAAAATAAAANKG
jgi:hypothetical protein